MRPYFSLVIPYHNSAGTIGKLLSSISVSKNAPPYEIIIVDDGSKLPMTKTMAQSFVQNRGRKHDVRVITFRRNLGPAAARNKGAKAGRGKFLVFLDSDVEVMPDTIHNLAVIYRDDPDVVAVTGVWMKEQKSKAFFPNYKALRDWSYWINERDKSGYYYLFSTRIASIKKAVFMRLGGFDERYPGALVEDIELTYRIARRYAIIFAPNVRVRHEFEGFWPIAKKYFLRAYYWTKLYQRRKKFDPVATTIQEAVASISGAGTLVFILLLLISFLTVFLAMANNPGKALMTIIGSYYFQGLVIFFGIFGFFHLLLVRKFLVFLIKEKGIVFACKGFLTGLVLYLIIALGALAGRLKNRL
jgi:glycosyltransferase involved in cell wall biosynthesis